MWLPTAYKINKQPVPIKWHELLKKEYSIILSVLLDEEPIFSIRINMDCLQYFLTKNRFCQHQLNRRPRKVLNYETPYEVFFEKPLHLVLQFVTQLCTIMLYTCVLLFCNIHYSLLYNFKKQL